MKRNFILTGILFVAVCPAASATIINIPDDYLTIQQGIDVSTDGDTVLVQPDTYIENINFNGHNIVLGSLFLTTGDTTYIAETIIDGDSSGSVVIFESGEDSTAVICGLTIQNGFAEYGGGIHCNNNSNCIISHNIISSNTAATFYGGQGAGIFCGTDSNPRINNNLISENNAIGQFYPGYGGGIFCLESSPIIVKNTICYNSAGGSGGSIYCLRAYPVIIYNKITGNSAGHSGGIYCADSNPRIVNNTINHNSAVDSGGGIKCFRSSPWIINNIISGNSADSSGGGVLCHYLSNPILVNNILWGNTTPEVEDDDNSFPEITYCDIEGGWEGEGNIDTDPLFRDPDNGDFHLMSTVCGDPYDSPCIDTGSPAILDSLLDCSWGLGELRSDMGAYGGGDSSTVGINDQKPEIPIRFGLSQNYPNPFNATTVIRYALPEAADVRMEIHDIMGRKVETLTDGEKPAGNHTIIWNADDYPSGIYFARLEIGDRSQSIKMVLLK